MSDLDLPALAAAPNRWENDPDTYVEQAIAWHEAFEPWAAALPAFAAALQALVSGVDFNGTSATSLAIGTGTKNFTASTGKLWNAGQFVIAASDADEANYMIGQVTSYNSVTGALAIVVPTGGTGGSGTFADWVISLVPVPANVLVKAGGTMTGALTTATPASGQEALIIPHGAAPSAPTNGSIWSTTAALFARINGATQTLMTLAGGTLTGILNTVASGTSRAGLNVPHGSAPTSPTNGDLWSTTAAFFARINGTTRQIATTDAAETLTNKRIQTPPYTITDAADFAISPANGLRQKVTLGANRTPTVSGWASGDRVELWIDDGSGYTIDWSTINPTHIGGTAPTLETSGWTKLLLEYDASTYHLTNQTPQDAATSGISYVGGTTSTGTTSAGTTAPNISLTGLTGGLSSSPAADDLVVVAVAVASFDSNLNIAMTTAGYTENQDLYINNAGNYSTNLAVYYKKMGSTPDTSFDLSIPANTNGTYAVAVQVFRGVNTSTPLDTTTTTATNAASVLVNPPSITPVTNPNCLVLIGAGAHNGGVDTYTASYLTNFLTAGANATYDTTVGMGYLRNIIAAYEGAAWTHSQADTSGFSCISVAMILRAA